MFTGPPELIITFERNELLNSFTILCVLFWDGCAELPDNAITLTLYLLLNGTFLVKRIPREEKGRACLVYSYDLENVCLLRHRLVHQGYDKLRLNGGRISETDFYGADFSFFVVIVIAYLGRKLIIFYYCLAFSMN